MNFWSMLGRVLVTALIVGLWAYEAHLWRSRLRIVFRRDPSSFWERVVLPDGVKMAQLTLSTSGGGEGKLTTDRYSQEMLRAACDPTSSRTTAVCDISALDCLCGERENWLRQYLACNPGWRFHRRYGKQIAERRVRLGDQWHHQNWEALLDCTPKGATDDGFDEDFDSVKSNSTIYFGGLEFNWDRCKSGGQVNLPLKPQGDDFNDIEVVCDGENLSLDVTELSTFVTSRVVQAAFDLTQREFMKVQNAMDWTQMKTALPEGAVRRGQTSLDMLYLLTVRGKICSTAYQAWVNPGEPGETYLKVFEVSQGVEIGASPELKDETLEFSGWSDDVEEKFMIGSGLPLQLKKDDCAVRLEVWFIPANGGTERKLVERVFRVKGGGR